MSERIESPRAKPRRDPPCIKEFACALLTFTAVCLSGRYFTGRHTPIGQVIDDLIDAATLPPSPAMRATWRDREGLAGSAGTAHEIVVDTVRTRFYPPWYEVRASLATDCTRSTSVVTTGCRPDILQDVRVVGNHLVMITHAWDVHVWSLAPLARGSVQTVAGARRVLGIECDCLVIGVGEAGDFALVDWPGAGDQGTGCTKVD